MKVSRADLSVKLKLRGRVVARNEVPLFFRRAGWIRSSDLQIGTQIEKGALLAELDDPALEDQIQAARFSLEMARVAFAQAQVPLAPGRIAAAADAITAAQRDVDTAKLRLEKAKIRPPEQDLVSFRAAVEKARVAVTLAQNEYDRFGWQRGGQASAEARVLHAATLDLQTAQADLDRALKGTRPEDIAILEAEVRAAEAVMQVAKSNHEYELQAEQTRAEQREAAIKRAQAEVSLRDGEVARLQGRLQDLKLVAPFSGSIVSLEVRAGDKVNPFQTLAILADPSDIEIEANVPEDDMLQVSIGQDAQLVMDGFPNQRYKAKVAQIPSKPMLWQGKQVYQVRLDFAGDERAPATIRMGSDVEFNVIKSKVLLLPVGALLGDEGRRYVEVPSGSSTSKVNVVVGSTNGTYAEVVSGLREGDSVVVRQQK